MDRVSFLKILGLSVLSPSILVFEGTNVHEVKPSEYKPVRWPIYPQKIQFKYKEHSKVCSTMFSYVKIDRNDIEYLIPIRESCIGDDSHLEERFKMSAKKIQEKYQIVDWLNDTDFQIKYDKNIHHN